LNEVCFIVWAIEIKHQRREVITGQKKETVNIKPRKGEKS
jgi:hypothetical protein